MGTFVPTLFGQLYEKRLIQKPIFSLLLINAHKGVLSVGGTSAPALEQIEAQTGLVSAPKAEKRLDKRDSRRKHVVKIREGSWEAAWKWSNVQGAAGWWQILMQGVWVDGVKVLKNQPAVIDVSDIGASNLCVTEPYPPRT